MAESTALREKSAAGAATLPDRERLEAFKGQVFTDANGAMGVLMAFMGDKLGLFRRLAEDGPATSDELASAAGLDERMLREWLSAVASAGYVQYEPKGRRFAVLPEQRAVLAEEENPASILGLLDIIYTYFNDEPKLREAMRHGRGLDWGEHHPCMFCGTNRFFTPLYAASLLQQWLPAIQGLTDRLRAGIDVADVGCGHGTSTRMLAEAFPASRFTGFDYHAGSIEDARRNAEAAGFNNLSFAAASAKTFEGAFDLICFFDALHDMGDPVGAAVHARERLKPGGVVMLVEPYAEDTLEENLTSDHAPVSRLFYAASTMACVPASQAQEVGRALGAQAGRHRLFGVLEEAGFTQMRVAVATAANLVIEARR